jgi:hypothetical protein
MKYERAKQELAETGTTKMKAFGSSMTPLIKSGSSLTFKREEQYEIGHIVFCKVKGRYIDAHLVTKKDAGKGYMISNNHNHDNGWTKTVYGRVVRAEHGQDARDF